MIDPVALLQDLIRCASVTPLDEGAQDVLINALTPLGFKSYDVTRGNIRNTFLRYDGQATAPLGELAMLDDTGFRARFSGSPIKRIGRARFLRNVCYAIGNSGDPALARVLPPLCDDPDPTLAEAAAWALARLT